MPLYTSVCRHCYCVFKLPFRTDCCNQCRKERTDVMDDIVSYLKEYPNSNAMQIADGLGLPVTTILRYMEEGKLTRVRGNFIKWKGDGNDSLYQR